MPSQDVQCQMLLLHLLQDDVRQRSGRGCRCQGAFGRWWVILEDLQACAAKQVRLPRRQHSHHFSSKESYCEAGVQIELFTLYIFFSFIPYFACLLILFYSSWLSHSQLWTAKCPCCGSDKVFDFSYLKGGNGKHLVWGTWHSSCLSKIQ